MAKEPFWGPNAKPIIIQFAIGVTLALLAKFFVYDHLVEFFKS